MVKRKLVVTLLAVLLVSTLIGPSGRASDSEDWSLLDKIEEAKQALQDENVDILRGVVGTRRVRVGRRSYRQVPVQGIVGREMSLAIADRDGRIHIARGIKRDRGIEVHTPGIVLSVRRDNGFNSDIAVISPAGGKVLAVKYPISNENNRFGPRGAVIQAVYVPYSPEIKTGETIERGIEVQDSFIDRAIETLRERNVFSMAFPGRKVVDVIPRDILTILLLNEHIDPGDFRSPGHARDLAERVLTIIGTNRKKAYAFSISPAGARGLIQMIPSTYALINRKYPSARLNPSFPLGMADPVNAVMAQILLCDSDWQAIRTRQDIPAERIGPYLAAAYNGGVGRVLNILSSDQSEWMESPDPNRRPTRVVTQRVPVRVRRNGRMQTRYVVRSSRQPIFRDETSKYVKQYHWINAFMTERNSEARDGGSETVDGDN